MEYKSIIIGVSAGGKQALSTILPHLPADFAFAVIVVAHRHPDSEDYLERFLNAKCQTSVKQVDEKERIKDGVVYLAPPNYHLLIEDDYTFALSVDEPVNYARPSIDVLFESAAYVYGNQIVGLILTGANKDGSQGLKKIKASGGLTIVQEPATAEVDTMPKAAIAATQVDYVLPLQEIGPFLKSLITTKLKPATLQLR